MPSLKLPKGTSTYPPSPKHETKTRTHQCPNPACCPAGVRKNFLLHHLGWVPRTSPPCLLANVYSPARGLSGNYQVVMGWRQIVESCLWAGACWQKEEREDWLSQCKDSRLECSGHKWCLLHYEDHAKKERTMFLERGWSLTLVAQSWLPHCKPNKGEAWTYMKISTKVKLEPTLSSPERWELSFSIPQTGWSKNMNWMAKPASCIKPYICRSKGSCTNHVTSPSFSALM